MLQLTNRQDLQDIIQQTKDMFPNIRIQKSEFPGGYFKNYRYLHDTLSISISCEITSWWDSDYEFPYDKLRAFIEPKLIEFKKNNDITGLRIILEIRSSFIT